jgi:hypothetical protein
MLRPRPWRRLSTPRSRCLGLDRTGGRRRRCRGRRPGGSPSPRQQLVDALCRVGGDAREDVAQIARGGRKSKTVAGRQGRAVGDRPADPVCEKRHDPYGCPDRRDSREHQGVGLDDAGAGGRGWRSDCGPRQDTRRRQRLVVSPKKRSFASELLPASLRDQGLLDLGEAELGGTSGPHAPRRFHAVGPNSPLQDTNCAEAAESKAAR